MARTGRPRCDLRSKLDKMAIGDKIVSKPTPNKSKAVRNMLLRVSNERGDVRYSLRTVEKNKIVIRCLPRGDMMVYATNNPIKSRSIFSRIKQAVGF